MLTARLRVVRATCLHHRGKPEQVEYQACCFYSRDHPERAWRGRRSGFPT